MDGPALLERLDRVMAELAELRAELAAVQAAGGNGPESHTALDDFDEANLLDTHACASRFGYPRDTVALWCRQGDGRKVGGRWLASVPRLQRRLNSRSRV